MSNQILPVLLLLLATNFGHAQSPCPSNSTPGADLCEDACIYCNLNGYVGSSAGYTPQTPPGFCGGIQNEQWFGFFASGSTATFTVTPSACTLGDGLQIALYDGCQGSPVACDGGSVGGAGTPATITVGMVVGQFYLFMIDGTNGDQCNFVINVSPPSAVASLPIGAVGAITGPGIICPGASVVYNLPPVNNATTYIWTGPPGTTFNGIPTPATIPEGDNGRHVTVTFGSTGGQICVKPINACYTGQMVCKNVVIQPIPPKTLAPVAICFEDQPYILPWGTPVTATGLYQTTLTSYLGCDSIVKQFVTIKIPLVSAQPKKTVCPGGSITVCGNTVDQNGPYSITCPSFQGCDSTVTGILEILSPVADITSGGTISCNSDTITLNSAPTQGVKTWLNGAGQTIGTGSSIKVTTAGQYVLQVTISQGTVSCSATDTVNVLANTTPPNASAVGATLGCGAAASAMLNGGSTTTGVSFAWSGPNGYSSNIEDPTVTVSGSYVLTVTNPANGCTASATATVTANNNVPQAAAVGDTLTCVKTIGQISVSSNVAGATVSWSGPGGFSSTNSTANVTQSGTYVATVTDPGNGCSSTATATVGLNNAAPAPSVAGAAISCTNPSVSLVCQFVGGSFQFSYVWSNGATTQTIMLNSAGKFTVTVTAPNGCTGTATAMITGNTTPPGATAVGGILTCAQPTLSLTGGTTSGDQFAWAGPASFSSNQQNPAASAVGTYTITVTNSANNCTSTATANVTGDFAVPNATAAGGIISCQATSIPLNANSTTPGATYSWVGPGNFSSTQQNPNVSNTGIYTVTVRGTNGCTSTASATVDPDANVPNAMASGGTLTCLQTAVSLNGSSTTPGVGFAWSGPGGFNTTNPNPSVSVAGDYILTVTNPMNGCLALVTATVNVDKTPPQVTAAGGQITCANPSFQIKITTSATGLTYSWAGPAGFPGSTLAEPTVTLPGNYILTSTGTNGCTATTSATILADQNTPVLSATAAVLTCKNPMATISTNSNLPVTYFWIGPGGFNSTLQNPTVSQAGDYTLIATNQASGCTAAQVVTVTSDFNPPLVVATGGKLDCLNLTAMLASTSNVPGSTFSWTGPGGFTSNLQNPTVSASGNYTVVGTAPNGCTSSEKASVVLDVAPPTILAAALDTLTCTKTSAGLFAQVFANPSPVQSVVWTGPGGFSAPGNSATATLPGNYTLTATSQNGCTSSSQVVVFQDIKVPNVSAVGEELTCQIAQIQLAGGSATAGAVFAWTGPGGFTSALQNPMASTVGDYVLRVTGPNGCTAEATAKVTLNDQLPDASVPVTVPVLTCTLTSASLLGGSNTPGATFTWTGPGGFSANTATANGVILPGTYTLTVNAPNGCSSVRTVQVTEDKTLPSVFATGDTTDCKSTSGDLSGGSNTPGALCKWIRVSDGSTVATTCAATVSVAGIYRLVVTGTNGCTASTTAEISQNLTPPQISTMGATLSCTAPSVVIFATSTPTGATYKWSGPGGFTSNLQGPLVGQVGVYTVTVTRGDNGCTGTKTAEVKADASFPEAVAVGDSLTCAKLTATLRGTTNLPSNTFSWSGPGGFTSMAANPTATLPGVYTLVVKNLANGCTSSTTATVLENKALPNFQTQVSGKLTCTVKDVLVSANATQSGNYDFKWSTADGQILGGSAGQTISAGSAGTYTVVVTNLANGCTASRDVPVESDPATPSGADATVRDVHCFGEANGAISVDSILGGTAPFLYSLDGSGFGATTNFEPLQPGTHTLKIQDALGCEFEKTFFVAEPPALAVWLGADAKLKLGEPFVFQSISKSVSDPARAVTWQVSPPEFAAFVCDTCGHVFYPSHTYIYMVSVADSNGCTASDERLVEVDKTRLVFIPNVLDFGPSGNNFITVFGGNGTLKVRSFRVYDRWGEAVFERLDMALNDPTVGWHGDFRGEHVQPGVYIYVAEVEFLDGEVGVYKGDITVLGN